MTVDIANQCVNRWEIWNAQCLLWVKSGKARTEDRQLGASSGIAAIRVLNPERAMAKRVLLAQSAWR
jgi:hypothetical protein